jgi:AcrR family transcriptional regulator
MRERILTAVKEVTLAEGVDRLSVAEVALRSGLARSVVYNYFADTRALLIAYAEAETQRLVKDLRAALQTESGPTGRLKVYLARRLADFAAEPQLPGIELAALLGPEGHDRMRAHVQPLTDLLVEIIEAGAAAGEFVRSDPRPTAAYIEACLSAEWHPLGQRMRDLDAATGRVTAFVLRALCAQNRSGGPAA